VQHKDEKQKKKRRSKKSGVFICRGTCFLTRHIKKALIKEEEKKYMVYTRSFTFF
jgi:hypothetical protein